MGKLGYRFRKQALLFMLVVVGCMLRPVTVKGQFWDEWFNQKSTQTKYLSQQIVALQAYIGHVKKTYSIAKQGLDFIGDMTNGELKLHDGFFRSLKSINPEIGRYARVKDIIDLQLKTVKACNRYYREAGKEALLRSEELDYILRVNGRVLQDCAQILDELIVLTTAGKLELRDDERINRIDKLHMNMQENYVFAESFGSGSLQLARSRNNEQSDIMNSKVWNGIK